MARMPDSGWSGGTPGGNDGGKKKGGRKRNPIPTAPTRPGGLPSSTPSGSGSSGGGRSKTSTGSKGSTGGGGVSGYEKRAVARENEAQRKAADRYITQAGNLESQARALQHALRKDFARGRDQQLRDIGQVLRQQQHVVREGYRGRYGNLRGAAKDNEKAEAGQSGINAGNVLRERGDALNEIMALGAGESDSLQAQLMSLRNWHANQNEVNRAYHDSLRSINSSLTDLNIDTKTALANNEIQANADREQLWTNYYDQRSEALTQLGNIRGQQADYYAQAVEMGRKAAAGDADKGRDKNKGKNDGKGRDNDRDRDGKGKGKDRPKTARLMAWGGPNEVPSQRPTRREVEEEQERQRRGGRNRGNDRGGKRDPNPNNVRGGWNMEDALSNTKRAQKEARQEKKQRQADRRFINRTADDMREANRQSRKAFLNAAKQTGKSWNNPGVSDRVMEWDGRDKFETGAGTLSRIEAARTVSLGERPEGATLRKW